MDEIDQPWANDITIFDIDRIYARLVTQSDDFNHGQPDGFRSSPLVGENVHWGIDYGFAGVILYVVESGSILLRRREQSTPVERERETTSLFGGRIRRHEAPSTTTIRELAEESGIILSADRLLPLRWGIEKRTPIKIFRSISVAFLDRMPVGLQIGKGLAVEIVQAPFVQECESLTWLSREDLLYFMDQWFPRATYTRA